MVRIQILIISLYLCEFFTTECHERRPGKEGTTPPCHVDALFGAFPVPSNAMRRGFLPLFIVYIYIKINPNKTCQTRGMGMGLRRVP